MVISEIDLNFMCAFVQFHLSLICKVTEWLFFYSLKMIYTDLPLPINAHKGLPVRAWDVIYSYGVMS